MGNISPFTEHGLEILPLIFSVFCELLPFHIQQNNFIKLFGSIRFNPLPFEIISRITIHLSHVPSRQGNDHGTQYRSAIYPLTPEQDAAARASLERFQAAMLAADDDRRITTEIANATPFYYAEDDHQQYLHKNPYGYCGIGGIGVCLPPEA